MSIGVVGRVRGRVEFCVWVRVTVVGLMVSVPSN
jgi:hypothetical protein